MQSALFNFIEKYVPLTEEEKAALMSLNIFRVAKKGSLLLSQGQYTNESFFVLQGCIRTFYIVDGDERTTEFYIEMEGFTPPCVFSKTPSDLYVSCVEDSIFTVSNPQMESEIFEKFPKFESLCRVRSEELLAKNQICFDEFKTSSPEQRYINLLKTRPDLLKRVPQHQLASYLGIKPQSLSRLRARIVGKKS
jgi:CRP-like cAMP-binding protein